MNMLWMEIENAYTCTYMQLGDSYCEIEWDHEVFSIVSFQLDENVQV